MEKLKNLGKVLWHGVGKYVVAMVVSGLLVQHVPGIDPQTAQQVGAAVGQAVGQ